MALFKYCPHCLSQNFTFTNQRKFACADCGTVFYQNVATAVAVIIEYENKILFTVRNKKPERGKLDLPGGFTDPEETAEETCARELFEELQLHIEPHQFSYFTSAYNTYLYKGFPYKTADLVFTAQLPKDASFHLEKEEIQAIKWIEKTAIPYNEIAFVSLQKALKKYVSTSLK